MVRWRAPRSKRKLLRLGAESAQPTTAAQINCCLSLPNIEARDSRMVIRLRRNVAGDTSGKWGSWSMALSSWTNSGAISCMSKVSSSHAWPTRH